MKIRYDSLLRWYVYLVVLRVYVLYIGANELDTNICCMSTFTVPLIFHTEQTQQPKYSFYTVLYPCFTYRTYGDEKQAQLFQILRLYSTRSDLVTTNQGFSLFPFIFYQSSTDPTNSYLAVWPIAGEIKNRFFWDEVRFICWPMYIKTRKGLTETENIIWPIFHVRRGDTTGIQLWPLFGLETAAIDRSHLEITNYVKRGFIMWPFLQWRYKGYEDELKSKEIVVFPFYAERVDADILYQCYGWPFGLGITTNKLAQYKQYELLWPFIRFSYGVSNETFRIWPFIHIGKDHRQDSFHLLWPLWTEKLIYDEKATTKVQRLCLILWHNKELIDNKGITKKKRMSLWPIFTIERKEDGAELLKIFSIIDPIVGSNPYVDRLYSPLWTIYRLEKDPIYEHHKQTFLWHLYSREQKGENFRQISYLFGLVKYRKINDSKELRLLFLPIRW